MDIVEPLIALLLVGLGAGFAGEVRDPTGTLLALLVYLGITVVHDRLAVRRQLAAHRPFAVSPVSRIVEAVAFGLLCLGTDWVSVAILASGGVPGVWLVVGIAPFLLARAIRAAAAQPVDVAAGFRRWSRGQAVAFALRAVALVVLPLILVNGVAEALLTTEVLGRLVETYRELVLAAVVLIVMPAVFAVAPLLFRFVLGARPLPDGALRERLLAYSRRTGYRPNAILVWNTGGAITNALFVGIVPGLRYVVLTDALLATLDDAAIEAVYAHEIGHGARRHTLIYVALAVAAALLSELLNEALLGWIATLDGSLGAALRGSTAEAILLGISGVLVGVFVLLFGMGWLSRRFETEADLHAVTTLATPGEFPRALEMVGLHLGILRKEGGLRHFGIGRRLGLVNRYLSEPDFRVSFDRLVRRMKAGVVLSLVVALGLFALRVPALLERGDVRKLYLEAREADTVQAWAAVIRALEARAEASSAEFDSTVAAAWSGLADARMRAGEYSAARAAVESLARVAPSFDPIADYNRRMMPLLLDAVEGRGTELDLRRSLRELAELSEQVAVDPSSFAETTTDLALALRAAGGRDDLDTEARTSTDALRWLLSLEADLGAGKAAPSANSQSLETRAVAEVGRNRLRQDLLLRIARGRHAATWIGRHLEERLASH